MRGYIKVTGVMALSPSRPAEVDPQSVLRRSVIGVFAHSVHPLTKRGMKGEIITGPGLRELACFIDGRLNKRPRRVIMDRSRRISFIVEILCEMREEAQVWYMDGSWFMSNQVMDAQRPPKTRAEKQSFRDDRHHHGEPATQSRRKRTKAVTRELALGGARI